MFDTTEAPLIKINGDDPRFVIEATFFGWSEVRRVVEAAHCELTEKRIGLITKRFTVRGNVYSLQSFVNLVWDNPVLGAEFRQATVEAAAK